MPKTKLSNEDITRLISLYQTEIPSTHKLGELFKIGHKKVSSILKDNNVSINKKGGQVKNGDSEIIEKSHINIYSSGDTTKKLIAVCKKTKLEFDDPNNLSGTLTRHILNEYGNVPIPNNTYQRKKYEITNGKKWFEEYFDIVESNKVDVRRCGLCDWTTEDIKNKTGCFENHIVNSHNILIDDYLILFPENIDLHKKYINKKELENTYNHIICKICGEKMKYLTNTHLLTHKLTLCDYKLKFPTSVFLSENYKDKLKKIYANGLKNHEHTFTSKPQIEITEFIESFGLSVKRNNKKLLGGVEIDILIDELKLGIEYNGLYYHTEKMGKTKNFHLAKTKLMNDIDYKLIHIFEDEWMINKELIKNKITHLIGLNKNETIGGRKCHIVDISNKIKNDFLNLYHIQGKDNSIIHIGAMYNDELVSVMCFDNKRKMSLTNNEIDEYELTRFATNTNYKIPGIANKLLKAFIKKYNPSKIISFGDVRWVLDSDNNMYTKLGFKLVDVKPPEYKYYNPKISKYKRFHKFGFGLNSLKRKFPNLEFNNPDGTSKTEKQLTTELGYDRIWDCGLFKYELVF